MMFDVQISEQADKDLREIYEYITFTLMSPDSAVGLLDRLEEAIGNLDHMPKRYRRYESEPWRSRGLRFFPVDNYLVFYIPDEELEVVTVIRVLYGGMDVSNELRRHIAK